jgi:hypothetical protein
LGCVANRCVTVEEVAAAKRRFIVAAGVALFVALAMLRIVLRVPIAWI